MESKKYSDLFLVNQEFARYLYHESDSYESALYALVAGYATSFGSEGLKLSGSPKVGFEEMSSPPFMLALINAIIKLTGAKTILEIGTFIGHTSIQLARMVGERGHVTTLELGKEFADLARSNFAQNGFADRVTVIEGDAGATMMRFPQRSFDMVFIDGAKQSYLDYALRAETLLTDRGVIIVDDVFFHGDALNAVPSTDKGLGCKRLLDHYRDHKQFESLLLPLRNGILILFRREVH